MATYLFTSYDIDDAEKYAPYTENAIPILQRYGGSVVAADPNAITFGGGDRDVNVILKFPSMAAAMQMIDDPEYQPWKELRLSTTSNLTSVLMAGV